MLPLLLLLLLLLPDEALGGVAVCLTPVGWEM